jgi:hypothetical protein
MLRSLLLGIGLSIAIPLGADQRESDDGGAPDLNSWAGPRALPSPTSPILLESAFGASPAARNAQYHALLDIEGAQVWYDWHGGVRRVAGRAPFRWSNDLASRESATVLARIVEWLRTILLATDSEVLRLHETKLEPGGALQVIFTEDIGEIPVRDSWITLRAGPEDGAIDEISAKFLPARGLESQPAIDAHAATRRALEWIHERSGAPIVRSAEQLPQMPGIELRRPAYLSYRIGDESPSRGRPNPRLVWVIEIDRDGRPYEEIEVDAVNSTLVGLIEHERGWYVYPPPVRELPRARLDPTLVARWMSYSSLRSMPLPPQQADRDTMSGQPAQLRLPPPAYRTRPVSLLGTVLEGRISREALETQFRALQAMPDVWVEYSAFGAPTSISGDLDLVLPDSAVHLKAFDPVPQLLALLGPLLLARGTESLQILNNVVHDPLPERADLRHLVRRRIDLLQSIRGIPVIPHAMSVARIEIEADPVSGEITRISGRFLPDWGLPTEPKISAKEAIERRFARDLGVVPFEQGTSSGIVASVCTERGNIEFSDSPPTLAYVFGPPGPGWIPGEFGRLVWRITYFDGCDWLETWVDAVDGTVIGIPMQTSVS